MVEVDEAVVVPELVEVEVTVVLAVVLAVEVPVVVDVDVELVDAVVLTVVVAVVLDSVVAVDVAVLVSEVLDVLDAVEVWVLEEVVVELLVTGGSRPATLRMGGLERPIAAGSGPQQVVLPGVRSGPWTLELEAPTDGPVVLIRSVSERAAPPAE